MGAFMELLYQAIIAFLFVFIVFFILGVSGCLSYGHKAEPFLFSVAVVSFFVVVILLAGIAVVWFWEIPAAAHPFLKKVIAFLLVSAFGCLGGMTAGDVGNMRITRNR
ncbi:MAG: hypothetical protein A3G49_05585 [Candidatus Sungbacteria bacterium RIFCSPLOWO2_12_FULL_41_11]|uniref:Uncharacterized protein n=1 Tax=Candidatus Sungbacteria bacterium RIFCSPLOWO2_12_FULL_41_11 TaxID=1802286 RepID=A0A1G2LSP2_9BACT|nr:MAG: hypothetical protein A3D41_02745 [Candidatus Sungbacteria bacterium RIFCSPHIGHO2_02_FULL_41_12b]OHA14627.1 MAG: hypothetical protein A3G49_05585 [Candidatus Sungbacteria bacterium RIFCSPLOWO2_12_FULL_41_11]